MNIIANSCVGARLYQVNNEIYSNPFMWQLMDSSSVINLLTRFEKINFNNIRIIPSKYIHTSPDKYSNMIKLEHVNGFCIFDLIIDNTISMCYLHYRFDPRYNKPYTHDIDVYYNHIWEYIHEKYRARLARMLQMAEEPKFVITCDGKSYTVEQQRKIIETKREYKRILLTNDLPDYKDDKSLVICSNIHKINNTMMLAKLYNDAILAF